jgi:beta-glucanase (GH16 family)
MPQFRPIPNFDKDKGNDIVESEENLAGKTTVLLPPLSMNTSGRMPVILLSGPQPNTDTDRLSAIVRQASGTDPIAVFKTMGDTTGRLLVIPVDEKLKRKRVASQTQKQFTPLSPQKSRSRSAITAWTAILLFGLELTLLFSPLFSNAPLFKDPIAANNNDGNTTTCNAQCHTQFVNITSHSGDSTPGSASTSTSGSTPIPTPSGPIGAPVPTPPPTGPLPPTIDSAWKLTFDDEFSGTGVDWTKWQNGGQNWGSGGGGEEQAYLPNECSVSNGLLQIRADNTSAQGKPYSSCMLNTIGTFQQTYGYFECRAKIPQGQGFWPAFWLYSSAYNSYEIDTMENLGNDTSTYYMTYHSPSGQQQSAYHGVNLAAGYHIYAVKWTPNAITYYLDNNPLFTVTNNVYNGPMGIFVNFAVGGNWPGSPNASTVFPNYFNIDYIRAYAIPG